MKAKSIEVKVCSSTCVTNHLNVWSLGTIVKDKALASPFGGSMHRSDIWNDVQKHRVYICVLTLRCVCAWVSNFCFDLLLHFTYRNEKQRSQGPKQPGADLDQVVQSSELLHQGLSRTAMENAEASLSQFLQVEPQPLFYWRKTMTSGLLGHSVLILPFFGIWTPRTPRRAEQTRQQRWRIWSKTWWEDGSLSILLFPSWCVRDSVSWSFELKCWLKG